MCAHDTARSPTRCLGTTETVTASVSVRGGAVFAENDRIGTDK